MVVSRERIRIRHADTEVACHCMRFGPYERSVEHAHLHYIAAVKREIPGDAKAGLIPAAG